MTARVAILMGSSSDWRVMAAAAEQLLSLGVDHEARVLSAHRTPYDLTEFGPAASAAGYRVLIAGAGGAAHLPGMLAATTVLPVIGVPIAATTLAGVDALLSIAQMPRGVPVATMAIDGAANAGLLAAQILALEDPALTHQLEALRAQAAAASRATSADLP